MLERPSLTYPPSSFPEANNFFLKSTHPMISMLQSVFQYFPTNWNKNTSYQRIKWSQSYLRKIIYESAFIKLSLLIAEVITHLKILRTSISGPDTNLIIWLLEAPQLLLKMEEIKANVTVYGMLSLKIFA